MISNTINKLYSELPSTVKLVAVSKFHPFEAIEEAYGAGQRIFAESRPQELLSKVKRLEELRQECPDPKRKIPPYTVYLVCLAHLLYHIL